MIAHNRLAGINQEASPSTNGKPRSKARRKKRPAREVEQSLLSDTRAWVQQVRETIHDLCDSIDRVSMVRGRNPKLAALLVEGDLQGLQDVLAQAAHDAGNLLTGIMPQSVADPLTAKLTGCCTCE